MPSSSLRLRIATLLHAPATTERGLARAATSRCIQPRHLATWPRRHVRCSSTSTCRRRAAPRARADRREHEGSRSHQGRVRVRHSERHGVGVCCRLAAATRACSWYLSLWKYAFMTGVHSKAGDRPSHIYKQMRTLGAVEDLFPNASSARAPSGRCMLARRAFRWGCRRPVHASLRSELPRCARRRLLGARGGADQRRAHVPLAICQTGWQRGLGRLQCDVQSNDSTADHEQRWQLPGLVYRQYGTRCRSGRRQGLPRILIRQLLPRRGERATPNSPRRFGAARVLAAWPHHHAARTLRKASISSDERP